MEEQVSAAIAAERVNPTRPAWSGIIQINMTRAYVESDKKGNVWVDV